MGDEPRKIRVGRSRRGYVVEVETSATVFERSVDRQVIVTVTSTGKVGFRIKGTKRTYWLRADGLYERAVKLGVQN